MPITASPTAEMIPEAKPHAMVMTPNKKAMLREKNSAALAKSNKIVLKSGKRVSSTELPST
ncbi:hypothetical protein [Pseudoalteromonas xiamenensis]